MKRFVVAAIAVVLATPSYAQFNMGGGDGQRDRTRYTAEERKREIEVEKAYKDAVANTRRATTETYDPWRNIRPGSETTATKPAR